MIRDTLQILLAVLLVLATVPVAFALPDGALLNVSTPETKTATAAGSVVAEGGNVTEVNITGSMKTDSWQGFFGNITGSNITLEDASGDVFYSWNLSNVTGEVYASVNSTIDFTTVTAVTDCTVDEDLTGTGSDRTNLTFTNQAVDFDIGAINIASACQTRSYSNSNPNPNFYEEIIVNASAGVESIYVTEIDQDADGFDGVKHDYQLLVPDNSTAATTTYFFYVEFD